MNAILVSLPDRLSCVGIEHLIRGEIPDCRLSFGYSTSDIAEKISKESYVLWITGLRFADGNSIDLLEEFDEKGIMPNTFVFLVAEIRQPFIVWLIGKTRIKSVLDPSADSAEDVRNALRLASLGKSYWSQTYLSVVASLGRNTQAFYRVLTPAQMVALSIFGEGLDDVSAGDVLGIQPASVHSMRQEIHRKLGIKHRGELINYAFKQGFLLSGQEGLSRVGARVLTRQLKGRLVGRLRYVGSCLNPD